jgi:CHAD domain-containing protein
MLETAQALQDKGPPRDCRTAGRAVIRLLKESREEAGTQLTTELGALPIEKLRETADAMRVLPVEALAFPEVLQGFTETYRRGRGLHRAVFEADADDERVHDLRKEVQQHWRHLQLLSNAWPKALRPHIALARELSEALGRDHDLAVLAAFAREAVARQEEPTKGLLAYADFCNGEQAKLRRHAGLLARRLYAEKPKSLRRRLKIYWETAEQLAAEKPEQDGGAKVIAIKR